MQENNEQNVNNAEEKIIVKVDCPNCGAKLIGSTRSPAIKCHWCHSLIPAQLYKENSVVTDQILPFSITKDKAEEIIENYVNEKRKMADSSFLKDYSKNDVSPIYLPYMLVDLKFHSKYTDCIGEKSLDDKNNISVYKVNREFDITTENLLLESSNTGSFNSNVSSSNVISAVSPFDTENCVKFNANYLNGFTSEERTLDVETMKAKIPEIIKYISDNEVKKTADDFDRGVRWSEPQNTVLGTQWTSVYLPIWLYSYYDKKMTYYIAVNGRTGKVVGSVPYNEDKINKKSLINFPFIILIIVVVVSLIPLVIFLSTFDFVPNEVKSIFIVSTIFGIILLATIFGLFAGLAYKRKKDKLKETYANSTATINYTHDFKSNISNLVKDDSIVDKYNTTNPGINK